jgi:ribosomal protein S18 acetylase RimI-like enzyme
MAKIRHLYRKVAIYGILLAAGFVIAIWLYISGVSPAAILLLFGAALVVLAVAYLMFEPLALYIFRAKISNKASEPRLHRIMDGICERAGIMAPRLAIINDNIVDAFTGGTTRGRAIIFITSGSLNEFNDNELEAILAHELESVGEMSFFIYDLIMMSCSALTIAYGAAMNSLLLRNASDLQAAGPVARAGLSDVPDATRLLIANGMYSYTYLHRLVRLAKQRSPLFLAAYHDGKPAGFIIGGVDAPFQKSVHIYKFIVDGRYRKMGIGGRLINAFIDVAAGAGFHDCRLEVRMDNEGAISLYEKMEFKRLALLRGFYPGGTDGLILCRSIVK